MNINRIDQITVCLVMAIVKNGGFLLIRNDRKSSGGSSGRRLVFDFEVDFLLADFFLVAMVDPLKVYMDSMTNNIQ